MAQNEMFDEITNIGPTRGLNTLLRNEFRKWRHTKLWWSQIIIWLTIINLVLFFIVGMPKFASEGGSDPLPTINEGLFFYVLFSGMWPAFAIAIIMQNVIVGEKKSGTAAWILSKPVSRFAYILSKLINNTLGILVTVIIIPGLVAFVELLIIFPETPLSPVNFFLGLTLLTLNSLFYLTLTLMLGTIFKEPGPVIGIPIAFFMSQFLIPMLFPPILEFLPTPLFLGLGPEGEGSLTAQVILGEPLASVIPIIMTLAYIVIFTLVTFWRFPRDEF